MKTIVQQPGGRKYFGDDFMLMQLNSLLLEKMLAAYGNFVVYGCTKNGTSISAGVVMLGGEFATFDGVTGVSAAYYVQPQVSTLQGPYRDDVREAYQVRKAVACTSNAEGAFRLDNAPRFENVVKLTKSQITDFPTSLPASDVYAWAKAATKPTYTASEVKAQPILVSGTNIKTINRQSILGSGDMAIEIGNYMYFAPAQKGDGSGLNWANAKAFSVAAYNAVPANTACLFLGDGTQKYVLSGTLTVAADKPVYGGFVGNGLVQEKSEVTRFDSTWAYAQFSKYATVFEGGSFTGFSLSTGAYISGIIVGNCSSTGGTGGIYVGTKGSATNCTVINCSGSGGTGGIYINTNGSAVNCTIANCSSSWRGSGVGGGGIYVNGLGSATNCTVTNCSTDGNGGGIYINSSGVATNCMVTNCSSDNVGNGIYVNMSGNATDCMVTNCSGSGSGGICVSIYGSIINCAVANCSSSGVGGIDLNGTAINCIVVNCSTNNVGSVGGILIGSSGTMSKCRIYWVLCSVKTCF